MKKQEVILRELWDDVKHNNFRIIGISEETEREKEIGKVFEKILADRVTRNLQWFLW